MWQYRRLLIAVAIFLSGVALLPYISLSSEPFGWQMFSDVYEDQPALVLNHETGQPGSFFTVIGSDFPSSATANIWVNGVKLTDVLIDDKGGFELVLDTTNADLGFYVVRASVNPEAAAGFWLYAEAPLRPKEGTGPESRVPSGIAFTRFIYLPTVLR
jgi:hypothetical protein